MKRVHAILVSTVVAVVALVATMAALVVRRARFRNEIQHTWHRLETTGQVPAPAPEHVSHAFSPAMLASLPKPVQRYFAHAIAPGTPLASSVTLTMHGTIKLGERWHPFTARQILALFRGLVWSAHTKMGALWLEGADIFTPGYGRMRFDIFGLLTVVNATGEDVRRSAAGRLAGESMWQPAALLPHHGVQWVAHDDTHISATMTIDGEQLTVNYTIDEAGQLLNLVFNRWHTDEQRFVPFGFDVLDERSFGGYTIPSRGHGGWWYGTERYEQSGRFFACTIEQAEYS